MQTQSASTTHGSTDRHPVRRPASFRRSARDRVLVGVAGGLGERLGIEPMIVRLAFIALAMAGGAGVILYLAAWFVSGDPDPRSDVEPPRSSVQQTLGVASILLGVLVLLRAAGVWFGDTLVWPVVVAVFGSGLIWSRGDEDVRARWTRLAQRMPGMPARLVTSSASPGRIFVGACLIAAGMAAFLAVNDALPGLRSLLFAVAVTICGAALILGPGVLRLGRQLSEERRERIRSEERAEVAAHLHDSVLQTLALLQRTDSPQEMVRLARVQERELRTWLYGKSTVPGHDLLSTAVEEMAARIESLHDISVETVVVGDSPLSGQVEAVVAACAEAVTNAAKHSGARDVSVYVEVEADAISAFIRDQGKGFEIDAVPDDRRGISESIVGRMQRSGGSATIISRRGEGTEVQLRLPGDGR